MENVLEVFREYGRLEREREEDGLTPAQLERWTHLKRLLASHFQPGTGKEIADKRSSLRVPSQLQVSFDSYGELRECLMTDISRGGVSVALGQGDGTAEPLPIGTKLTLRIEVAESGQVHELPGEVASVETGGDTAMGIRFGDLTDDQRELVRVLYGRAMDEIIKTIS